MMEIDVTKGKTEPRNRGDLNPPEFNSIDEERSCLLYTSDAADE